MWMGWVTNDLKVRASQPIGGAEPSGLQNSCFLAAADEQCAVDAVLNAVRDVLKVQDGPALPNLQNPILDGEQYVYGYFENSDEPGGQNCFYIGKGSRDRWLQHVADRATRTAKERKIDAWIEAQHLGAPIAHPDGQPLMRPVHDLIQLAQHQLVRLIGRWHGEYAEACAFAAEYALIRGKLGVYNLTNLTSGNDRFGEMRFLVRDAGLNLSEGAACKIWTQAAKTFAENPADPKLENNFRPLLHLLGNARFLEGLDDRLATVELIPHQKKAKVIASTSPPAHHRAEGASGACVTYMPTDDRPIRIQLGLSLSEAGTIINIRPRCNTVNGRDRYMKFMQNVNLNGFTHEHIRNQNVAPYFKPFATDGKGKNDTLFPLIDVERRVITNPTWAPGVGSLNLVGALQLFLEKFS